MSSNNSSGSVVDDQYLIRVSDDIPTLDECTAFVSHPSCGAISTFSGITRNNFDGKTVIKLSYEGYIPMAEKELRKICEEARARYPSIFRIATVHILGDCPVESASVIVCASSPHRRDAMHCVEFCIDELKARVPIWKREVYVEKDGNAVWKENVEWSEGKRKRVMTKEKESER